MATFFFFTLLSISFFLLLLPRNVVVNSTRLENDSSSSQFDLATLIPTSLKLLGDAHWNNGSLRLSRDLGVPYSGSGRVLYSKPVKFRQPGTHFPVSFSTFFTFSVSNLNPSSIGGGLAFVISPDDQTVGLAGGYLGLVSEIGTTSPGFVSVEFDTLMDIEFKDINGNHVGLDLNSMVSSQAGDLGLVGVELKSGDLVSAWIDYDGVSRVFNVSVSYSNRRPVEPLLSFDLDLDRYVNDFMFVGFSGSTQGSTEVHSIEAWSFSSSFNSPSASPLPSTPFGYGLSLPPPTSAFFNPTANAAPPALDSLAPSGSVSSSPQKREKISSSSSCHNQLCKQGPGAVAGVVTAGAFFLAICAGLLIWGFTKKYKFIKKPESLNSGIFSIPKEFSYKELKTATRCFDPVRIIGHGAFGTVYKGIFPETGALIAVKRCSHGGGQGRDEFLSELSIIGTLRHRNLVRLQGWCHEKGEILLVYDLMPNVQCGEIHCNIHRKLQGNINVARFSQPLTDPGPH
ncbi:hypothetical protein IFM89_000515 [Coptis chinensis]|uniref:Protein kinase domain-containing protein n=1 Tax=Coptis chinensis TaxID=261450 RepID=A0A835H2F3_9MAGN|nr:hypothetical protein IFM89_000515 [Coptis chinensis]